LAHKIKITKKTDESQTRDTRGSDKLYLIEPA